MTGKQTYYIHCDGCGRVYRPSTALSPTPKNLYEVRKLAAAESWRHELAQILGYQGVSPSLDFCGGCDAAVSARVMLQILERGGPPGGKS